jgi:NADH:ubiquinone oxidoreductase subunit E
MSKKISVCNGKSCKKSNSKKYIKQWVKELVEKGKLKKIKKTKCLGVCKKGFAIEYKGKVHSCYSKEELKEMIVDKEKGEK